MKEFIKIFLPPILLTLKSKLFNLVYWYRMKKHLTDSLNFKLNSNKKCFIIGSGPSIKNQDLRLIKNSQIIFLNNMFIHEDFEYLCLHNQVYVLIAPLHSPQTREEWSDWLVNMNNKLPKSVKLIFGMNNYIDNVKSIICEKNLFKGFDLRYYLPRYQYCSKKIKINFNSLVSECSTASVYAVMYSKFSGVKETFLIGVDHNYIIYSKESEMRYYSHAPHQTQEIKRQVLKNDESYAYHYFFRTAQIIKQYELLNDADFQIFIVSKESFVKNLPKVELEQIVF